jgi:hypothetical protein
VIAGVVAAVAATGSAQAAAPSSGDCLGQYFSSHAGIVPAIGGGEEGVGGFVSVSVRESEPPRAGGALAHATKRPRADHSVRSDPRGRSRPVAIALRGSSRPPTTSTKSS